MYLLEALMCCILLLSACQEDANNPLRFYNNVYEVPMGGTRYLGLESGNGDYDLSISDQRIASAQSESGWTTPGGSAIYVRGILTGKTYLTVTDKATQESCVIEIKVVDNYQNLRLLRGSTHLSPDGSASILPGVSDIFLINNSARDAYFFKQGVQTAFSSGLELIAKGSYEIQLLDGEVGGGESRNGELANGQSDCGLSDNVQSASSQSRSDQLRSDQSLNNQSRSDQSLNESNNEKAMITLTYAANPNVQPTRHKFIMWANSYIFHRLNKTLNLNWDTPPIGYNRTSVAPPPSYILEEVKEQGEGNKISFIFSEIEMPTGLLNVTQ